MWIGAYDVGSTGTGVGTTHTQAITDISAGVESFVNGYGNDVTTVNGFVLGPTGDVLNFNPSSWATGTLTGGIHEFGLSAAGAAAPAHGTDATLQLLTVAGSTPFTAPDVILDGIAVYANATQFNNALHQATVGDIHTTDTGVIIAHASFQELVAYSTGTGINIADVSVVNATGTIQNSDSANTNLTVTVHDLVHLTGTSSLGTLASHNIHFV